MKRLGKWLAHYLGDRRMSFMDYMLLTAFIRFLDQGDWTGCAIVLIIGCLFDLVYQRATQGKDNAAEG